MNIVTGGKNDASYTYDQTLFHFMDHYIRFVYGFNNCFEQFWRARSGRKIISVRYFHCQRRFAA
jgi:hypothetical protein